MSILVDRNTRLLVQGITGKEGSYHAARCREYGTNLVAGVTPGKGGQVFDGDVPVYDTVERAVDETGANASLIFVPPPFAADAIVESVDAGIPVIATITEGVPVKDSVNVVRYLQGKDVTAIGPNCPGIISPGEQCKMGIMPGAMHMPGRVGIVSRSGTLTYEAVGQLTGLGIGQSTSVGIGGDPVNGTSFVDVLELFNDDTETDCVVFIGEIGGTKEQEAAEYIGSDEFTKPVAALIVGRSAPPGRRMGHAGAIITGKAARADEKIKALERAGATIIPSPADIGVTVQQVSRSYPRRRERGYRLGHRKELYEKCSRSSTYRQDGYRNRRGARHRAGHRRGPRGGWGEGHGDGPYRSLPETSAGTHGVQGTAHRDFGRRRHGQRGLAAND